jgi:acetylornithine deacetylase
VFKAVQAYALYRESVCSHPLYDPYYKSRVPLAICRIQSGEWASTFAGECIMEGSIECLPGEEIEEIKHGFKKYLAKVGLQDPWLSAHPPELEWFGLRLESAEVPINHPLVETTARLIEQEIGRHPIIGGGGGCDLRLPVLHGNTPAVIYGPGGGLAHSVDEYVDFEQVITCLKVISKLAVEWCGVDATGL